MIILVIAIPLLILAFIYNKFLVRKIRKTVVGRHVVVTGGSSGIGKCLAILAAQQGAHVTIIARDNDKLEQAYIEIKEKVISRSQIITKLSVDVTNNLHIQKAIVDMENIIGPIYMLINCVELNIYGKLEHMLAEDIRNMVNTNVLGSIFPIRGLLQSLKSRKEGIIVMVASEAALFGMYGYSVYSGCKFALRGIAESLAMEMKPYNVSVTLVVPPATDTSGFVFRNGFQPEESRRISESAPLYEPEEVAEQILDDALCGNFLSYIGFETAIMTTLCAGMSPFSSVLELLMQSVFMGFLRLIGACCLKHFERIFKYDHLDNDSDSF